MSDGFARNHNIQGPQPEVVGMTFAQESTDAVGGVKDEPWFRPHMNNRVLRPWRARQGLV
jgi:hypothetical protein